jgi:hypothetical protein
MYHHNVPSTIREHFHTRLASEIASEIAFDYSPY